MTSYPSSFCKLVEKLSVFLSAKHFITFQTVFMIKVEESSQWEPLLVKSLTWKRRGAVGGSGHRLYHVWCQGRKQQSSRFLQKSIFCANSWGQMGATHKLLFDRNFKGARSQNRIWMMSLINQLKLSSNFREKWSNR